MQDLLRYIVSELVNNPDAVKVDEGDRRGHPVLRLHIDPEDRGIVIGRQGRTIRAIETLLRAAAGSGPVPDLEVVD